IRDFHVTGVQTCALPILRGQRQGAGRQLGHDAVPQPVRVMAMKRTLTLILALALGGCASFHELREDTEDASLYQPPALDYEQAQIGRASCREREEVSEGR